MRSAGQRKDFPGGTAHVFPLTCSRSFPTLIGAVELYVCLFQNHQTTADARGVKGIAFLFARGHFSTGNENSYRVNHPQRLYKRDWKAVKLAWAHIKIPGVTIPGRAPGDSGRGGGH